MLIDVFLGVWRSQDFVICAAFYHLPMCSRLRSFKDAHHCRDPESGGRREQKGHEKWYSALNSGTNGLLVKTDPSTSCCL